MSSDKQPMGPDTPDPDDSTANLPSLDHYLGLVDAALAAGHLTEDQARYANQVLPAMYQVLREEYDKIRTTGSGDAVRGSASYDDTGDPKVLHLHVDALHSDGPTAKIKSITDTPRIAQLSGTDAITFLETLQRIVLGDSKISGTISPAVKRDDP